MNLTLLSQKVLRRIRRVGLRQTAADVLERAFRTDSGTDFDLRNGTDTESRAPLWKFRIPFASASHGAEYRTVSEDRIIDALQDIPRYCTFIDLGCGKGRTLIVAKRQGFRKAIGVEFVPELFLIAKCNLRLTETYASVYHEDAGEWLFSDEPTCVYLYNPFGPEIMQKVSDNLRKHKGELYIVYLNHGCQGTSCTDIFDAWMPRFMQREGLLIWHRLGP